MKKITEKMAEAIREKRNWKLSNTEVYMTEDGKINVYLHENLIAEIKPINNGFYVVLNNCRWKTNVTKERLNGILDALGVHAQIVQRNYEWYLYNNTDMVEFEWKMYLSSFKNTWYRLNVRMGVYENV